MKTLVMAVWNLWQYHFCHFQFHAVYIVPLEFNKGPAILPLSFKWPSFIWPFKSELHMAPKIFYIAWVKVGSINALQKLQFMKTVPIIFCELLKKINISVNHLYNRWSLCWKKSHKCGLQLFIDFFYFINLSSSNGVFFVMVVLG